jgi:hypothetical protein
MHMLMNQRTALVQPHSTEAEMSVLGSMMLDPDAVEKVTEMLQPDDFYHPAHQILYRGDAPRCVSAIRRLTC